MSDPIPSPGIPSYWDASPELVRLLGRRLPADVLEHLRPGLEAMGRDASRRVAPLSVVADRESPRLVNHDARGLRIDRVEYHPSYREMESIAYGSGIVGLKYDPATPALLAEHRHMAGFSLGYLFAMAEASLFCPVCMTDGVARVLTRHGTDAHRRDVVPRLASRDTSRLDTGAMFLTERQGGSDVGANTTAARRSGDAWLLTGEKWFCSNVDARAILATARPEGAPDGTRGLSTFLIRAEGNPGVRIRRLKDKLGVRSMPTGEVELADCPAEEIGSFAAMAEMLNYSRLYNSIASAAVIGRAVLEARLYAEERMAFGRAVASQALAAEILLDLRAEHLFALHLAFDAVSALDRADAGDEEAAHLYRAAIPMVKAVTGKLSVPCVSESMELIGGNAYVEESPLPRLLRDAQVLPIWEGTTSILVLDALRVARKEGGHERLLSRIAAHFPAEADELRRRLPALEEREARGFLDRLARLYGVSLLIEAGEDAAAARLRGRPLGLAPGARP
jgi:alkylation response protein AidB-like acyl-CoA dehydrogenase